MHMNQPMVYARVQRCLASGQSSPEAFEHGIWLQSSGCALGGPEAKAFQARAG